MKKAFEAIWEQGKLIPREAINLNEQTRVLVVILDDPHEDRPRKNWQDLKGKYRGRLSSVSAFIQRKHEEKRLER
jgi:predicted DNA-binding antitoxin AbrB/MazE fold protein